MINALVKYNRVDTPEDKESGFYPPIGTFGVIEEVDDRGFHVRWDEGTKGDGIWWCKIDDVEVVYNPKTDGRVVAVRLYNAKPWYPMAEMVLTNRTVTVEWNTRNASYIDKHTRIYDDRVDISFDTCKSRTKMSLT